VNLLQRLRHSEPSEERSDLSLDGYMDLFQQASLSGGMLSTSWGDTTTEQVLDSAAAAYRVNGPVFSLVLARMLVFAEARFAWRRYERGRPTDLFGSEDLRVLERPWPGGTTGDLLSRMEQHASLTGNAFVRRVSRDRLSVLRPEWTTIILGSQENQDRPAEAADVEVAGYWYRPNRTGRGQIFLPGEVAHYAPIPDPDSHFRGMSWITPVMVDVHSDSLATRHKSKFFQNAATPNLAIKFDPTVTMERVKAFKELMEDEHQGWSNAYKTLFLGGGADPVMIGKDFRELEFAATTGAGETRLAAAAGVPPVIAGFSEGLQAATYSNYAQARRRFADGTMRPLWRNAAESLETIMRVPSDGSVHLWFDTRDIAFLREDSKDEAEIFQLRAQAMRTLVDGGWDPETVKTAVDTLDVSALQHSGMTSVQLQKPDNGDVADKGDGDE